MQVEWSVECAAEDPVLVVPWAVNGLSVGIRDSGGDEAGRELSTELAGFIDLRENPYDFDQIPEADRHPPLMQALRALNAPRSPWFTAKCDAWELDAEETEQMHLTLDLSAEMRRLAVSGFASYIDVVWRDRSIFASFHQCEQLLYRVERLAAPIDLPLTLLDCVLRPALVDFTGPQEGFAVTVYVKALGPDPHAARKKWGEALEAVVALLRGKDIAAA